jgi:Fur family zinc uptake transcriptional regulator
MTTSASESPFRPAAHDHSACVQDALADAEAYCRRHRLRLTENRRRVLEIIWRGHGPVKAYDIIDTMNAAGRKTAPPTVYRALEFLLEAGLVHRVDSLNAFVGCPRSPGAHHAQLLICSHCGTIAEIEDPAIREVVDQQSARHGFAVEPQTLEIRGACPACRRASQRDPGA